MRRTKNSLRNSIALISTALMAVTITGQLATAQVPVGTAFTYSGELQQGGSPVDDMCAFEFSLWDDDNDPDRYVAILLYVCTTHAHVHRRRCSPG